MSAGLRKKGLLKNKIEKELSTEKKEVEVTYGIEQMIQSISLM